MRASAGRLSVWGAGLFLALSLLVGQGVALWYKSRNPDHVDVTQGLAYLRPILLTSLVLLVVMWLASLVAGLRGLKTEDREIAKLGLGLLGAVTVLSLALAVVNSSLTDLTNPS